MAKVKNPNFEEIGKKKPPLGYSKRTIKKSGGDDFTNNVKFTEKKLKRNKK